ncbi:helix-turn-helix domain-containing protein [Devosia sp. Root635]|uniref:helix-turn-helix domain-containing protein n=1 Tax=Devosia sp. Root635 TaxID=1736575 RepID=UPI0006FEEC2C|nr:helix-turn-helix transcriptional regulator [Devosia sp. Root635]KRA40234.1 DNA-binding protein [Devosia sp. Root635]
MNIQYEEVGQRLRAYRLGKELSAEDVAERLGISRAAVYRLEKGEIVKIQILGALSTLLGVSLPSLLGVGVEYYNNAIAFFERMRQLEENAVQVLGNFSPVSSLLLSEDYMAHLRTMLVEAIPDGAPDRARQVDFVGKIIDLLEERRSTATRRGVPVVSIVGSQDLERFLRLGLIGRFDLPPDVQRERRAAARRELEMLYQTMLRQPIGVQVGIVDGQPPTQTFQVYDRQDTSAVTLSPYRLGDQPNVSSGIALVTSAPEAVSYFKDTLTQQWETAHKGSDGAQMLRNILDSTVEPG